MGLYGSSAAVKDLLASQEDDWPESQEARIQALLRTVSVLIEHETGMVFGGDEPESIEIEQYAPIYGRLLYLPKGLRSLTSVIVDPTWSGSAWVDGTELTATEYRLAAKSIEGVYRALLRVGGYWSGVYVVTGVWEDQHAEVPDEITYLANYLTAEIFKKQTASPAGFVGPDGATVPVRNTFREPEVQKILDRYRATARMVFV